MFAYVRMRGKAQKETFLSALRKPLRKIFIERMLIICFFGKKVLSLHPKYIIT